MNKFTIVSTGCECHPETCCCRAWKVLTPDGTTLVETDEKETADTIATAMNTKRTKRRA